MRAGLLFVVLSLALFVSAQTIHSGPGNRAEWTFQGATLVDGSLDQQTLNFAFSAPSLVPTVNGVTYTSASLTEINPKLYRGDAMSTGDFNMYVEYYFPSEEPALRFTLYIQNEDYFYGLTDFTAQIYSGLGGNFVNIDASSSGDAVLSTDDFWFINSDGGSFSPYLTWNTFANTNGVLTPSLQTLSGSDYTVTYSFSNQGEDVIAISIFISMAASLDEAILSVDLWGNLDAMVSPPFPANFQSPGATCSMNIQITDSAFNSEISWEIYEFNTLISSGGGLANQNFTIVDTSPHRIEMFDSFGDGWNGGIYIITRNSDGVVERVGGLFTGFSGVQDLDLECEGDAPANPLLHQSGVGIGSICNFFNGYKNMLASEATQKRHLFNEPWFC